MNELVFSPRALRRAALLVGSPTHTPRSHRHVGCTQSTGYHHFDGTSLKVHSVFVGKHHEKWPLKEPRHYPGSAKSRTEANPPSEWFCHSTNVARAVQEKRLLHVAEAAKAAAAKEVIEKHYGARSVEEQAPSASRARPFLSVQYHRPDEEVLRAGDYVTGTSWYNDPPALTRGSEQANLDDYGPGAAWAAEEREIASRLAVPRPPIGQPGGMAANPPVHGRPPPKTARPASAPSQRAPPPAPLSVETLRTFARLTAEAEAGRITNKRAFDTAADADVGRAIIVYRSIPMAGSVSSGPETYAAERALRFPTTTRPNTARGPGSPRILPPSHSSVNPAWFAWPTEPPGGSLGHWSRTALRDPPIKLTGDVLRKHYHHKKFGTERV